MSGTEAIAPWSEMSLDSTDANRKDFLRRRHHVSAVLILVAACALAMAIAREQWLVTACAIAASILFLSPVAVALGLYVLIMPLDGLAIPGSEGTFTWLAGAFAGGVLLIYGLGSRRLRVPPPSTLFWGLFALWSAGSVVWAINEEFANSQFMTVIGLFGLYAVAAGLQFTERELSLLSAFAIVGGSIAGALLILQGPLPETEQRATLAFSGQMLNPNQVANGLLIPFVLGLAAFWSARGLIAKALPVAALTVIGAGIFLTGSRGALLSLTVAMVSFVARAGSKKRLLIPLVALAVIMCFLPLSFFQRLRLAATDRGTGRLDIFVAGAQVVKHNPVLGTGLANFQVAYEEYAGFAPIFRGYDRAAHNTYLEVCGETGFIGLGLFLIAIVVQLRTSARVLAQSFPRNYLLIAAEAGCYALLVYGFFGSVQWRKSFWLGWLLLAIFAKSAATANEQHASSTRYS